MLKEHDLIVLTTDIQDKDGDLKAGDVGTVVHVHPGDEAFVVEFNTLHAGPWLSPLSCLLRCVL